MPNQYTNDTNNELHTIAKPIIDKFHSHLQDAQIHFLWRENELKDKGDSRYGEVKKCSDLLKHFSGGDFLITVWRYGWDKFLLPEKRVALMDHLLSHCKVALTKDGYPKEDSYGDPLWQLTKPDADLFYEVVRRHGAWNDSLTTVWSIAQNQTKESVN